MVELGGSGNPSASYKFNSFEEIKSHSSILFNERMAIQFYLLDMRAIEMNTNYNIHDILTTRAILKQIYKNMRMLLRYNPVVRATLNLETKERGVYTTDVGFSMIDRMIEICQEEGFTQKKLYIIVQEINHLEMLIKDILQYFNYFIRPDFKAKPDIDVATQKYKQIADARTVEELKSLVGKSHKVDFESLGVQKIELEPTIKKTEKKLIGEIKEVSDEDTINAEQEWESSETDEVEVDSEGSNPASDGNYDSPEWKSL